MEMETLWLPELAWANVFIYAKPISIPFMEFVGVARVNDFGIQHEFS